jgi:S-DNA-T family DNA segregation ATPase FtsK/SpoIIIE
MDWFMVVLVVGLVLLLNYRRWRRNHRPKVKEDHASSVRRWVGWVSSHWAWDAQNLGLALVDDTTRHRRHWLTHEVLPPVVRIPAIRFEALQNGLRAWMHTLPGVGIEQVTKAAGHLANAWGCVRVDVTQHSPGLLCLRGFVSDPLVGVWKVQPTGDPLTEWNLHVGRDDEGEQVYLPLANLSGITVAGVPGTGKTSLQRWWLCQLAPHPAVQIAFFDGKVSEPYLGDYGPLSERCFAVAGDDLSEANQLLERLWRTMRARSSWLREVRGSSQFWDHAPDPQCPLVVIIVDESHTYVTGASRKDRELCESNIWYLTKLAKEGRSRGFLTVFVTQKQTADAIPTAIRDVCQVGISFGVRTMDGAVAALGDEIRQYPDVAPAQLIGREWIGVAVMRLPDRPGFHRVRVPYVSEEDAARVVVDNCGFLRWQFQIMRGIDVLEEGDQLSEAAR